MGPLFINRHRRAVWCPGFIGARVQGGHAGSSRQAGVGDCALLDFSSGFFAVADASDRNPSASREFMVLFSRMLEGITPLSALRVYDREEVFALKGRLIEDSGKLLSSLPFRNGSTFTGVFILRVMDGMAAIVMHTGDSLLISCDLAAPAACQFTSNNFWMVGRSHRFFQIDDLPISRTTRLFLATDGISGLSVPPGMEREKYVLSLFDVYGPDEIPDHLLGEEESCPNGWDDLAIIAIDPFQMSFVSAGIIIGGTSGPEEGIFQKEKSRGLILNRYDPITPSSGDDGYEKILLS